MNKKEQRLKTQLRLLTEYNPEEISPAVRDYYLRYITELWSEAATCRLAIQAIIWCLVAQDYREETAQWLRQQTRAGNRLVLAMLVYESSRSVLARTRLMDQSLLTCETIQIGKLTWEECAAQFKVPHNYQHEPSDEEGYVACRIVLPNYLPASFEHVLNEILDYRQWHEERELQIATFELLDHPMRFDIVARVLASRLVALWPAIRNFLSSPGEKHYDQLLAEFVVANRQHLDEEGRQGLVCYNNNVYLLGAAFELLADVATPCREITTFIEALWRLRDRKTAGNLHIDYNVAQAYLDVKGVSWLRVVTDLPLELIRHSLLKHLDLPVASSAYQRFDGGKLADFRAVYGSHVEAGEAPLKFVTGVYFNYLEQAIDGEFYPLMAADIAGWLANYPLDRLQPTAANMADLVLLSQLCDKHQINCDRMFLVGHIERLQQAGAKVPERLVPKKPIALPRNHASGQPQTALDLWSTNFDDLLLRSGEKPHFLAASLLVSYLPEYKTDLAIRVLKPVREKDGKVWEALLELGFTEVSTGWGLTPHQDDLRRAVISLQASDPAAFRQEDRDRLNCWIRADEGGLFRLLFGCYKSFLDWAMPTKEQLDHFYTYLAKSPIDGQHRTWAPWLIRTGGAKRYSVWLLKHLPTGRSERKVVTWVMWARYVKDRPDIRRAAARLCEGPPAIANVALQIANPEYPQLACADEAMFSRVPLNTPVSL